MLVLSEKAGEPTGDADAAIRQLYTRHARALRRYAERFCPDQASAEDIVQETFIRAWRHLPQLASGEVPVRPWLYRVARNLLTDAGRAARSRPVMVRALAAEQGRDDTGLNQVLDQQVVADALGRLSPAHRTVLVETFYQGIRWRRSPASSAYLRHGTITAPLRPAGTAPAAGRPRSNPAAMVPGGAGARTRGRRRSGGTGRDQAAPHVIQVAQPPPRPAEPSKSPINLSS